MQITGDTRIEAGRQRVWEALNDPDILRRALPGCESLVREGDGFAAVVAVKIGPVGARFKGQVAIENPDPPKGYTLVGQGTGGMAGSAKGSAQVSLAEQGPATHLTYTVDADVGGRLAQLGGPLIETTARQLAAKFFANLQREIGGDDRGGDTQDAQRVATAPGSATTSGAALLWPWLAVIAVAVIAGYLLGRADVSYGWIVGTVALSLVCLAAGIALGRGGRR